MRIESSPKSAARTGPRPASPLSAASARTASFKALFPQLKLLGRLLREPSLLKQWPAAPKPGTRRDGPQADKFVGPQPTGSGLPIRITSRPRPPSRPLGLAPWVPKTKLEPWTGTRIKPWLHRPDIFGTPGCPTGAVRGCGLPIRIT
ncbi:hypothetical protein [Myxococcus sp. CA040A]|uniref:hypothetical protein n=1 Tax=Myxococcus sp. CA040A TaxID=2741738 RepID=UPI00157B534E|nr:hypothetical protein [Myxococcus sp. CA040A]NTX04874.1 hypothetical protein [Myxococcus sp. CA040A]